MVNIARDKLERNNQMKFEQFTKVIVSFFSY